jgi:hypothetical protein
MPFTPDMFLPKMPPRIPALHIHLSTYAHWVLWLKIKKNLSYYRFSLNQIGKPSMILHLFLFFYFYFFPPCPFLFSFFVDMKKLEITKAHPDTHKRWAVANSMQKRVR